MRLASVLAVALGTLLLLPAALPQRQAQATTPIYVNDDANGANDGTTWENAFTSLQTALEGAGVGREIWVAAGTYTPSSPAGRAATFSLANDVKVYGSFAGDEESLAERELTPIYTSVLTGEIGTPEQEDNVYHVVTVPAGSGPALDGFRVMRGFADGPGAYGWRGGGMLHFGDSGAFRHLWISDNHANQGGGVYHHGIGGTYSHILFDDNDAVAGAGLTALFGAPVIRESTFLSNDAEVTGGAMLITGFDTQAYVTNITVLGGSAFYASAIDVDGGADLFLTNASISGANSSGSQGAVRVDDAAAAALLQNVILWANFGGQAVENAGSLSIYDSIVQGGCPAGAACDANILDQDPLFELPGANHGGFVPTLALPQGSPAVDAGTNGPCPSFDARGGKRKFDGDGDAVADCDIGSYEFIAKPALELVATADTVAEADAYLHVHVKLSHAYPEPVSVTVTATGGTASPGVDYTDTGAGGYLLTADPGTTNFGVGLAIVHDALDEPDETAVFKISKPANTVIDGPTVMTVTIVDDDATPSMAFEISKSSGRERVRKPAIIVKLSAPSGIDVHVSVLPGGTATAGADYVGPVTPVAIPAGKTSALVNLSIVDDGTPEMVETIVLKLSGPDGATLGTPSTHVYRIQNDDRPTKCFGLATTIYGTLGNDSIKGTPGADVIDARSGADRITGLDGNDVICGRGGADTVRGAAGRDRIDGGAGPDLLRGGGGNDKLLGTNGNDMLFGQAGRDHLAGAQGTDLCDGGPARTRWPRRTDVRP